LAANQLFIQLHNPDAKPGDMVHKVANPYDDDGREIFFFADPPHLIKTVRNAWCKEAEETAKFADTFDKFLTASMRVVLR